MRPLAERTVSRLAIATLMAIATLRPAMAEDIDLYTGVQPAAGKPNVLIVLDNASTWDATANFTCSTAGVVSSNNDGKDVGSQQCALYNAIDSIRRSTSLFANINIGMMMFGTGKNVGGVFRYPSTAPYKLPLMDTAGIDGFLSYIKSIDRQADNANNSQVAGGMQEAWAYFAGQTGLSGTKYTSPIDNPCQKNFVIYIANAVNNGKPQDTGTNAFDALVKAGATTAQQQQIVIPSYAGYQSNWGDEWARFMNQTDVLGNMENRQNVTTYTIAVTDGANPDYVSFAGSMASNGGGKSYVVKLGKPDDMTSVLLQIFNELQDANSVFASVSLPASVNAQGQYLNQVYIGMFRPDKTAAPRWVGNLKQYKIGYDANHNIVLQDARDPNSKADNYDNIALSGATGFLAPSARSFWTREAPLAFTASGYSTSAVQDWPSGGFWQNSPSGESTYQYYDANDGPIVEKGGAGEMLRAQYLTSQDTRRLLTCDGACSNAAAFTSFDTSNQWLTGTNGLAAINSGTSGAATISSTEMPRLISWVRGEDVAAAAARAQASGSGKGNSTPTPVAGSQAGPEAQMGPGLPVTVRPSVHADVLHSRPAVVNYGGTTGVVVYYGTNDGVFHAINGNQTRGIGSVRPGGELWGFVAPEFLGKLSRVYTNTPEVKLSTTPDGITPAPTPRDYFFDGSTTVMQDLRDPANPHIVLFLTARRGARLVYAIEVTDPNNPRFLWKVTNANVAELGQSWSQPRVMRVSGYANPLVVMGAGYDPAEDSDPSPGVNTMGRGILAFDAYQGNLVWSAQPSCTGVSGTCLAVPGMTRAIPSDVTLLDRNGDGNIDRLYVGDVGGNLWRADFEIAGGNTKDKWTVSKLATLGGAANTNDARKFFYAPDVVATGSYDAVMAGTGDREHPLYSASATPGTAYNVVNRLYMIKDPNISGMATGWTPLTEANLFNATGVLYDGSASGYYITLTHPGEKAVNAPVTAAGYTTIGTNTPKTPTPGMCYPNLGEARVYAFNFVTAAGKNSQGYVDLKGGGFPPTAVFGMVAIDNGTSTSLEPVMIGGGAQEGGNGPDGTSALGVQKVKIAGVGKRKRTYWYQERDKR